MERGRREHKLLRCIFNTHQEIHTNSPPSTMSYAMSQIYKSDCSLPITLLGFSGCFFFSTWGVDSRFTDPKHLHCATDKCAVCQASHSQITAWAHCGWHTARLPRPLQNTRCISVPPAGLFDTLVAVMAQPGSILHVDMEYFLEFVLVNSMISLFLSISKGQYSVSE